MQSSIRADNEFLPASLEIQETPPPPLGRATMWVLVALVVVAIAWACLGRVDIVAVARGKVIPSTRVKVIQPVETSVVRAIHVTNGATVKAGQTLIELDPTLAAADDDRAVSQLESVRTELARYREIVAAATTGRSPRPGPRVTPGRDGLQSQLLSESLSAYAAQLDATDRDIEKATADEAVAAAQVDKLERTLPLVRERADAYRRLASENLVARTELLELEQQRIEAENDLRAQQAAAQSARAERAGLSSQRARIVAEFRAQALRRVEELERAEAALAQDRIKAERVRSQQTLTAPVDGVVQQLAVHTVGGVVSPAQPLMVVVPQESALEVEAYIENKDIGFVRSGQAIEVKIDSFPFTLYGTIPGVLATISDDAVPVEGQGLVYAATVRLKSDTLSVDGRPVKLSPGMAVTAEVLTGKRRLIEFVLAPLLRYRAEGGRER